jgi:DNA-binding transcriptional ArsR family regulator
MEGRDIADGAVVAERRIERELFHGESELAVEMERLGVVADETRFTVLYLLADRGPLTTRELAESMDAYQSQLYYHLSSLTEVGLTCAADDGRSQAYLLTSDGERFADALFAAFERRTLAETDAESTDPQWGRRLFEPGEESSTDEATSEESSTDEATSEESSTNETTSEALSEDETTCRKSSEDETTGDQPAESETVSGRE